MNITSIRVGRIHYRAGGPVEFKTVNLAKKESRRIGGYSAVRVLTKRPSDDELKRLLGEAA